MKRVKIFDAIEYLGGIPCASKRLLFTRQYIWYQIKTNNLKPSIELCKRIEKVTKGKFTLKLLRPDIFTD